MEPLEELRGRLESRINEFFLSTTSNDRKRQIETQLEDFSRQGGSWKQALYFLSTPQSLANEYFVMYCLSVIENTVRVRWLTMSGQEQSELQSTLYSYLIQHSAASAPSKCPNFLRNKIIKVLTDIGKVSWPHSHPDFLNSVLQITANDDTVVIGLHFLKTISEEWPNCKDEISTERKIQLKVLLVQDCKRIFELLEQILSAGLKQHPISSSNSGMNGDSHSSGKELNPVLHEIIALALETTAQFCSWIPLNGIAASAGGGGGPSSQLKTVPFSQDFLKILCQYATVDMTGSMTSSAGLENLSILGLNALNELMYRKFIPKEFDEHVNLVANFAVDLLSTIGNGQMLNRIQHKFLDKALEFVYLVVSTHFFRYDQTRSIAFISLLLPFTFAQHETVFYYECLEIWKLLLNHLIADVPFVNVTCNSEELMESFKQVFLDLALGIVTSTAKFNIADSEEYFEDEEDDEVEIPNLSKNIDVLVKIGELLPSESLERVTSTWETSGQYFASLQNKLDHSKTNLTIDNPMDLQHFSFVVQLIGRIAEIFYGEVFKNELDLGKTLVQQQIGLMMISKSFYFVQSPELVVQANCEIVYSLRTWTYWLGRYYSEIVLTESCSSTETQTFYEMLTASSEVLCFALENRASIPPSIILANANFFLTLINSIRSQHIFSLPWVQTLIEKTHTLRNSLETDTFRVLNKSVVVLLLLPWQSTSDQQWERRTSLYNQFMKNVMGELIAATAEVNPTPIVLWINVLNDQLDILTTECGAPKKICWSVYKEIVLFMHKLIPVFLRQPGVNEEMLNFFLKIMEVLRQQAGAQFFEETVRIFMNLFTAENIIKDLMKDNETSSSHVVVEKFLQMLQFMVKDPSPSFKKFLPDCLSVALDYIYPVLAQRTNPDAKIAFFQFIRDAVNFRWSYFFPGFLYQAPSESGSPSPPLTEDEAEINRRLTQIFESIGHSFLQSDLELFRFNLKTLSIWNQKHQVYNRMAIDLKMFDGFMSILIQVLARKTHDLLKEEIASNLYEMSLVDYARFWQAFLPQTLQKDFPQLNMEQRELLASKFKPKGSRTGSTHGLINSRSAEGMDLSTFSINLCKFIDDLRYLHFCIDCVNSANNSSKVRANATV